MANKKDFKNMNPNSAILDGGNDTEKKDGAAVERIPAQTEPTQEKSEKAYLRLDVTNYKDYISLMSDYKTTSTGKYKSMTQYILDLLEADKQDNIELYKKLLEIEQMKRELM